MFNKKLWGTGLILSLASLVALTVLLAVPLLSMASGNRVYYTPDVNSFLPAGSFGSMTAEGYGMGINKLVINAGPQPITVTFTINNTNNGSDGTTYFQTRKGPGDNDLSPNVKLSADNNFDNATNDTFLNFPDTVTDVPLYVQVQVPACLSGTVGTFRIQAHPGGTDLQGNGPGVVVYVNCAGYTPPTPTPTPVPTSSYK